jgi:hypothetical protein
MAAPTAKPRLVSCNGQLFQIINGRRAWLTTPPADILPDLLIHDPSTLSGSRSLDGDCCGDGNRRPC